MSIDQSRVNELSLVAQQIYKSLNSDSIDERVLVDVLSTTTNSERQIIRTIYKKLYHHPIQEDLKDGLNYKFKDLCISMFDTPYEFDARELHKAFHSFINDDKAIVEIFVSRPKSYLNIVDQAYSQFYNISLKEEIKKGTKEEYTLFLIAIMDIERPLEQTISGSDAFEIAKQLKSQGLNYYSKDENSFKNIFLNKSREDLILISRAYNELYNANLYEAISSEVSGKNKRLMKAILFSTISPSEWFAKKIYKAIEGIGTDNSSLNRVLISRAEIDMYAIRDYYYMDRKTNIASDIKGGTSGSYGEVLVNLALK